MKAGRARRSAATWMEGRASQLPDFRAAYLAGSTNWLADGDDLPIGSDVDVMIVADGSSLPRRRKFIFDGVLLEVSHLGVQQFRPPCSVLANYHLAPSFAATKVLVDPYAELAPIHAEVSRNFARRQWIWRRCDHVRESVLRHLRTTSQSGNLAHDAMSMLFAAGVCAHIPLVAALRNPTIRGRYVALHKLLAETGLSVWQETLLALLGVRHLSKEQVARHIASLAEEFDAAVLVNHAFPYAADITSLGREAVMDYTSDLVERGLHREAMFWVAVTHCRCREILAGQPPPAFCDLLSDLGLDTDGAIALRQQEIEAAIPLISELAQTLAENVTSSSASSLTPSKPPRH